MVVLGSFVWRNYSKFLCLLDFKVEETFSPNPMADDKDAHITKDKDKDKYRDNFNYLP